MSHGISLQWLWWCLTSHFRCSYSSGHTHLEGTVLSHSTHRAMITMSKVCSGHTHKQTLCKSITQFFGTHTKKGTHTNTDTLQLLLLLPPAFPFSLSLPEGHQCLSHNTATIFACFWDKLN